MEILKNEIIIIIRKLMNFIFKIISDSVDDFKKCIDYYLKTKQLIIRFILFLEIEVDNYEIIY